MADLKSQNPNVKLQRNPLPQFNQQAPQAIDDDPYMAVDDTDPYMEVDTIPNTENLLQKAIRQSRSAGMPMGSFMPTSREEVSDAFKVGIRQIIPDNPGLVGMGANIVDPGRDISLPAPETDYGRGLEAAGNTAQLLHLGGAGVSALKKPVGSLISKFRTGPIKEKIKSVEDLISNSKQAEMGFKEEAEKVSYVGSKSIKDQISGRFRDANKRFGEVFSQLESRMGDEDLAKVIKRAADDIGAPDVPGTPGNAMLNQIKKYGPQAKDGVVNMEPRIYNKEELQAVTREILDSLPNERSKTIFHKHLIDALPENIPGLKELKSSHSPIYRIAKESKSLSKSAIKRVASGRASDPEVEDLSRIAERLGTSHLERAKKVSSKNKLQKMITEQGESKLPGLERDLAKTTGRKNWAIGTGTSIVGLPLIGGLLKNLFGGKD